MALTVVNPASNPLLVNPARVEIELGVDGCTARRLVQIATDTIQRYCGRVFAVETVSERLAGKGVSTLRLARRPIVSVESVLIGTQAIPAEDFYIDADQGWLTLERGCWPESADHVRMIEDIAISRLNPRANITVQYTAGYNPIPFDLQDACMSLCRAVNSGVDRSYQSQSIGDWSYTLGSSDVIDGILMTLKRFR